MRATLLLLALCTGLGGCQYLKYPSGPDAGNPNHTAYAGAPGSAYDKAANPPVAPQPTSYNPNGPLPTHLDSDERLPPPNLPVVTPGAPVPANPPSPGR